METPSQRRSVRDLDARGRAPPRCAAAELHNQGGTHTKKRGSEKEKKIKNSVDSEKRVHRSARPLSTHSPPLLFLSPASISPSRDPPFPPPLQRPTSQCFALHLPPSIHTSTYLQRTFCLIVFSAIFVSSFRSSSLNFFLIFWDLICFVCIVFSCA